MHKAVTVESVDFLVRNRRKLSSVLINLILENILTD